MILKAVLVVFGCLFIGQVIIALTNLPLPPSVIGLTVLFFGLQTGVIQLSTVEKLAKVLMDHLVLMVIPASISIMQHLNVIREDFWVLLVGVGVSTILVLISTAGSYTWLRRLQKARHKSRQAGVCDDV